MRGLGTAPSVRDYLLVDSARVEDFSLEEGEWLVRRYEGLEATARIPSAEVHLTFGELEK